MQLERTPQPGQIWQHFKGNNYKILFVTGKPISGTNLDDFDITTDGIKHHETGYECLIAYANNKTALIYEHDVYNGDDCDEHDATYDDCVMMMLVSVMMDDDGGGESAADG